MNITIVGTGYVGLISGVCLASKGHKVTCVDNNSAIVNKLNKGIPTIYEKDLLDLLNKTRNSNLFFATDDIEHGLVESDAVIIAVGTPSENGVIDLTHVINAAKKIGEYIKSSNRYISILVKSTVVPGTTDIIIKKTIEESSGKKHGDFGLGMNPEFLREGEAIEDFIYPDRIIFGYEDNKTLEVLEAIYKPWNCEKIKVNTRTAEMIKYANNALLATQISTVNEIANLATKLGNIDMLDVIEGVTLDKRWNPIIDKVRVNPEILTYLIPGCGFGGSCFPKDVQALRSQGQQVGLPMEILNAVLSVNESQPLQIGNIIENEVKSLKNKTVLILGLAFKPDTDDVRESASLKIIPDLLKRGALIIASDPIANDNFKIFLDDTSNKVDYVDDWEFYIKDADIILIATRWEIYKKIYDHDLKNKIVFDARRLLSHDRLNSSAYLSIGCKIKKNFT